MRIQRASETSQRKLFNVAALDCLERNGNVEGAFMVGGVSEDGLVGWLARGAALEVFSTSSGDRMAAWCFGALLKEPNTVITAVCECRYDNGTKFLVATTTVGGQGGMICLFDIKTCKILKAFELAFEVTALEMVCAVTDRTRAALLLSHHLQCFSAVLAVGTQCGHTYLIDLCLDTKCDGSDELSPNGLYHVDTGLPDVVAKRYQAVTTGKHLCVELGEETHSRGYFYYKKPDGSVLKTYSADDICVSCLHFVKQTGLLIIGYNFGCFQLWKLQGPVLEYSSRFEANLSPVTQFAYQEPENDPRNFCYLWVGKGPLPSDSIQAYTSSITLFQLGYTKKTWFEDFGYLFEELTSVGHRFDHLLTSDPYNTSPAEEFGSRIISCYTLQNRTGILDTPAEQSLEEGGGGGDLSLGVVVWEAAAADPHAKSSYFMALFDINRWYHSQMPTAVRIYGGSHDVCPYLAVSSLDRIQQQSDPDNILALHVARGGVARFRSTITPAPEQHFYPSSLAFDAVCVVETGIVDAKFLGTQRQILSDLRCQGPDVLVEAGDIYNVCLHAGLIPRTAELSAATVTTASKRDAVLTMALEHDVIGFITDCIEQWSRTELPSVGCTMRVVLDWAWRRVAKAKEAVDRLCTYLYDWSGVPLDRHTLETLQDHHRSLCHLVTVFVCLNNQPLATTEQGRQDLETKLTVVTLISEHVAMVLWMCRVGLLPENSEDDDDLSSEAYAFPARVLAEFYRKRRAEVQGLHSKLSAKELLLMDGVVEDAGEALGGLWLREGGTPEYPPATLHAVLGIFLLDSLPTRTKQTIMFYLLCDLLNCASADRQAQLNEVLQQYTRTCSLPLGLSRMVQGMWLLDHKEFEDSLMCFLQPAVQGYMCAGQHRRIIKAYLYQGCPRLALKYLRLKQPPPATVEDVKLRLTVLLANGLTSEAFEYQRMCRNTLSPEDRLVHLFLGCQQMKTVDQLLRLPFSQEEERHLVNYLRTSTDVKSKELLVVYYLQRARYVEAIRLNNQISQQLMGELDPDARERTRVRNRIVDGYERVLPAVQRRLGCDRHNPLQQQRARTRREFTRPTPLSTVVKAGAKMTVTRSALMAAVLDKVQEVARPTAAQDMEEEEEEAPSDGFRGRADLDLGDPGPFVCTPVTARSSHGLREPPEIILHQPPTSGDGPPAPRLTLPTASPACALSPLTRCYTGRRSPGRSPGRCPAVSELSRLVGSLRKRQHQFTGEALSLLQTPPVTRRPSLRARGDAAATPAAARTPHSILKVRHRPVTKASSPAASPTKAGPRVGSLSDFHLPTPPRIKRRTTLTKAVLDDVTSGTKAPVDVSAAGEPGSSLEESNARLPETPKNLRFCEATPEGSVTEETPEGSLLEDDPETSLREADTDPGTSLREEETNLSILRVTPSPRPALRSRTPTPETVFTSRPHEKSKLGREISFSLATESRDSRASTPEAAVVAVDEDVTFNFDRSQLRNETEDMDTSPDTEPLAQLPTAAAGGATSDVSAPGGRGVPSDMTSAREILERVRVQALQAEATPSGTEEEDDIMETEPEVTQARDGTAAPPRKKTIWFECGDTEEEEADSVATSTTGRDADQGGRDHVAEHSLSDSDEVEEEIIDLRMSESETEETERNPDVENTGAVDMSNQNGHESDSCSDRSYSPDPPPGETPGQAAGAGDRPARPLAGGLAASPARSLFSQLTAPRAADKDAPDGTDSSVASRTLETHERSRRECLEHTSGGRTRLVEDTTERHRTETSRHAGTAACDDAATPTDKSTGADRRRATLLADDADGTPGTPRDTPRRSRLYSDTVGVSGGGRRRRSRLSSESAALTPSRRSSRLQDKHRATGTSALGDNPEEPRSPPSPPRPRRAGDTTSPLRRSPRLAAKAPHTQSPTPAATPTLRSGRTRTKRLGAKSSSVTSPAVWTGRTRSAGRPGKGQASRTLETPPRPSRVSVLPPTPPESSASSPASMESTIGGREPSPQGQGEGRAARNSVGKKLQAPKGDKVKARSRSTSPLTDEDDAPTKGTPEKTASVSRSRSSRSRRSATPLQNGTTETDATLTDVTMSLRSGRRVSTSRDHTPEACSTRRVSTSRDHTPEASSTPAVDPEDAETPCFTFAEPVALEAVREGEAQTTPVHAFIFSPPITRSKGRGRRDSTDSRRSLDLSDAALLASPARGTRSAKKKDPATGSSAMSLHYTPTDSPINFLSPVKEEAPGGGAPGGGARRPAGGAKMTLRSRQPAASKRKPLHW